MTIGIVGGMGSYATVDFFKRIIDAFPAEKEWERPRILIDNFCTMPSRVRAILYGEKRDELCKDLISSVRLLIQGGGDRIVLACNTSHVFIPEIYKALPESVNRIIDIIDVLAEELHYECIAEVDLIATEGTIDTKIYDEKFSRFNIQIKSPLKQQYRLIREFIEAVKQNNIDNTIIAKFNDFINSRLTNYVILGCTELPILYQKSLFFGYRFNKKVFDPLQSVIDVLKMEYENERNEYR